jgi:signal transduction histidine kinase
MFNTCPPVLGKEKLIQKSISETLHNAIRFSSGKEIRLSSEENDRFFALKITNSGKEIPLEKLESIKEAFGLAEEHADKSSGLGLAIVNTCQQLVNGNLNIESADGKITVTLQYQKA